MAKLIAPEDAGKTLHRDFVFWYKKKSGAGEKWPIEPLGRFNTVGGFWCLYNHMLRPGDSGGASETLLFENGVHPAWEDDAHTGGGRLVIRARRGSMSEQWETLLLSVVGGSFPLVERGASASPVTGIEFRQRYSEDTMTVWLRGPLTSERATLLRDELSVLLRVPLWIRIDFKAFRGGPSITVRDREGEITAEEAAAAREEEELHGGRDHRPTVARGPPGAGGGRGGGRGRGFTRSAGRGAGGNDKDQGGRDGGASFGSRRRRMGNMGNDRPERSSSGGGGGGGLWSGSWRDAAPEDTTTTTEPTQSATFSSNPTSAAPTQTAEEGQASRMLGFSRGASRHARPAARNEAFNTNTGIGPTIDARK